MQEKSLLFFYFLCKVFDTKRQCHKRRRQVEQIQKEWVRMGRWNLVHNVQNYPRPAGVTLCRFDIGRSCFMRPPRQTIDFHWFPEAAAALAAPASLDNN